MFGQRQAGVGEAELTALASLALGDPSEHQHMQNGERSALGVNGGASGSSVARGMHGLARGMSWPQSEVGLGDEEAHEVGNLVTPQPTDAPAVHLAALSIRQPYASLMMNGVKSLEARNRPVLRQVQGTLAIHISQKEEPYSSPLFQTAIALLRRRYSDETIGTLCQVPSHMTQYMGTAAGCVVGLVDVESTWHADMFSEVEQAQLTEQALHPAAGSFLTQLRNPRWLKYPVRAGGSNRLWRVQLPLDCLPEGYEVDGEGNVMSVGLVEFNAHQRNNAPQHGVGSGGVMDADDMGLGLLGDDMVRQLQDGDVQGEAEKKRKKLTKALRQISDLKTKKAQGVALEKTQEEKIAREAELVAELGQLDEEGAS